MDPEVPGSSPGGGTIPYRSAQARYAAYAAVACGYAFRSLDGEDGYLFEVSDGARAALFGAGAGSPYALNDTRAASIARDKAFCAEALRQAGVAVVPGRMFFVTERWREMRGPGREPEDALAWAAEAAYPVFCKPISASNGLYGEIIEGAAAFADYLERVGREHFAILVQPFVRAPEFRVFILNDKPLFSYRKTLPCVIGDGVRTIVSLAGGLVRRARDESGVELRGDTVLEPGRRAYLEGPANRSAGGGAADLRDGAPAHLACIARAAATALGLRLAGVDVFDIEGQGPMVIEVNSNPMLATLEDHGRWDLIEAIWRANFEAALR